MTTNKIQPPPRLAKILKDPSVAELDHFLLLLWQIVRNMDDSDLGVSAHLASRLNPHEVTADQAGADPAGTSSAHAALAEAHGSSGPVVGSTSAMIASLKAGTGANFTEFEADGTMVANGDAITWDDSQAAVTYMRVGGTALTLDVLDGGIYQYRFDKNDEIHSQIQLSHRYKVGTPIQLHIHLVNKAAVGATGYNAGISVEYMWASLEQVFQPAIVLPTVDCSFKNAVALTHKHFTISVLTPETTQGGMSSYLLMRVKRVAGTSEDLAGNNIFICGIDVHTQQDTLGSRQEDTK